MASEIEDSTVRDLLRKHRSVKAEMAKTELGQTLTKLEKALKAFGVDPNEVAPTRGRGRTKDADSVRSKVQRLLDSMPLGFSADGIIDSYEAIGEPIQASDPKSAIRTALWSLQKDGLVYKQSDGSFISAEHVLPPIAAEEA